MESGEGAIDTDMKKIDVDFELAREEENLYGIQQDLKDVKQSVTGIIRKYELYTECKLPDEERDGLNRLMDSLDDAINTAGKAADTLDSLRWLML